MSNTPKWWHCDTHGPGNSSAWGCPECVREMRGEIERLNALNGSLTDKCNSYIVDNARLAEQSERLRAEHDTALVNSVEIAKNQEQFCSELLAKIERLRKDAERYRYAQEHLRIGKMHYDRMSECHCEFDDMDSAAIDAALKEQR